MISLDDVAEYIGAPMHYHEGPIRDGLLAVMVTGPGSGDGLWPKGDDSPGPLGIDALQCAIELCRKVKKLIGVERSITTFDGGAVKQKIIVELYGEFAVSVLLETAHPANKSIARLLKKAARRSGLTRVEYSPCDTGQPNEQPAPSSKTPETETSSPSLEDKTSETGPSPEAN